MKIKVQPEDFIVKELVSFALAKKGAYGVYLLQKRNWNTIELLQEISRKLQLPIGCISYGGRKDRHGLSFQYITIKNPQLPDIQEKDYSLKFIGFMPRAMAPDLIAGNHFTVAVRNLNEKQIKQVISEISLITAYGYPNYFDDQRFGSYDTRQGFWAEKVLKGQFNGALKIYLTSISPDDKREERERRTFFFEHWRDWAVCFTKAKTKFEYEAFSFLKDNPQGFLPLLNQIPRADVTMFISAFQGYLWNEMLCRIIKERVGRNTKEYPGVAGNYVFYQHLSEQEYKYFADLALPVPGRKAVMNNNQVKDIYTQVLENHGLKQGMFNKLKLKKVLFNSFLRNSIIRPQDLYAKEEPDEIYQGKQKLVLEFTLPRGSYATMLLKRLFTD